MNGRTWLALLLLAAAPEAAAGQGLAQRVGATEDGAVRLSFAVREGVEICSRGIRRGDHRIQWRDDDGGWTQDVCSSGPAEVELRLVAGKVRSVRVLTESRPGTSGARSLGEVPASDAVAYFLGLPGSGLVTERGARDALFPAVIADVPDVWRGLLSLARDQGLGGDVRKGALFWLGQEAAEAATAGLADIAFAVDEEQGVRDAAVFALSQRPDDEGVPVLMELAQSAPQAKTRKTAFFWLAQSGDPRVVPFFERVLLGRGGG